MAFTKYSFFPDEDGLMPFETKERQKFLPGNYTDVLSLESKGELYRLFKALTGSDLTTDTLLSPEAQAIVAWFVQMSSENVERYDSFRALIGKNPSTKGTHITIPDSPVIDFDTVQSAFDKMGNIAADHVLRSHESRDLMADRPASVADEDVPEEKAADNVGRSPAGATDLEAERQKVLQEITPDKASVVSTSTSPGKPAATPTQTEARTAERQRVTEEIYGHAGVYPDSAPQKPTRRVPQTYGTHPHSAPPKPRVHIDSATEDRSTSAVAVSTPAPIRSTAAATSGAGSGRVSPIALQFDPESPKSTSPRNVESTSSSQSHTPTDPPEAGDSVSDSSFHTGDTGTRSQPDESSLVRETDADTEASVSDDDFTSSNPPTATPVPAPRRSRRQRGDAPEFHGIDQTPSVVAPDVTSTGSQLETEASKSESDSLTPDRTDATEPTSAPPPTSRTTETDMWSAEKVSKYIAGLNVLLEEFETQVSNYINILDRDPPESTTVVSDARVKMLMARSKCKDSRTRSIQHIPKVNWETLALIDAKLKHGMNDEHIVVRRRTDVRKTYNGQSVNITHTRGLLDRQRQLESVLLWTRREAENHVQPGDATSYGLFTQFHIGQFRIHQMEDHIKCISEALQKLPVDAMELALKQKPWREGDTDTIGYDVSLSPPPVPPPATGAGSDTRDVPPPPPQQPLSEKPEDIVARLKTLTTKHVVLATTAARVATTLRSMESDDGRRDELMTLLETTKEQLEACRKQCDIDIETLKTNVSMWPQIAAFDAKLRLDSKRPPMPRVTDYRITAEYVATMMATNGRTAAYLTEILDHKTTAIHDRDREFTLTGRPTYATELTIAMINLDTARTESQSASLSRLIGAYSDGIRGAAEAILNDDYVASDGRSDGANSDYDADSAFADDTAGWGGVPSDPVDAADVDIMHTSEETQEVTSEHEVQALVAVLREYTDVVAEWDSLGDTYTAEKEAGMDYSETLARINKVEAQKTKLSSKITDASPGILQRADKIFQGMLNASSAAPASPVAQTPALTPPAAPAVVRIPVSAPAPPIPPISLPKPPIGQYTRPTACPLDSFQEAKEEYVRIQYDSSHFRRAALPHVPSGGVSPSPAGRSNHVRTAVSDGLGGTVFGHEWYVKREDVARAKTDADATRIMDMAHAKARVDREDAARREKVARVAYLGSLHATPLELMARSAADAALRAATRLPPQPPPGSGGSTRTTATG